MFLFNVGSKESILVREPVIIESCVIKIMKKMVMVMEEIVQLGRSVRGIQRDGGCNRR